MYIKSANKSEFNGDNIFFTSDTHFGHRAIIKYCDRPFESTEEMNEALIKNWNDKVGKDDIIFHLGDFGGKTFKDWIPILERLNGYKYLIIGNHDRGKLCSEIGKYFKCVTLEAYIKVNGRKMYLNHCPFRCYDGVYRPKKEATWQLFGHVHYKKEGPNGEDIELLKGLLPTQFDVGVDNNNYAPISWAEIKARIEAQVDANKNMLEFDNYGVNEGNSGEE